MISDYAVILSILMFVAVDLAFALHTPKLLVPTEFKVSSLINLTNIQFILLKTI